MKLDDSVAFAALGLAVVETFKMYQDTAPSVKDLRCSSADDFMARQLLLDADFLGLFVVVAIGGGGSLLIRRWYPLLLAGAALLMISVYYRSVLRSRTPQSVMTEG